MRIPIVSILAASALAMAACSSPPHELPERGESKSFTVFATSDEVYRKVVEGARTCYAKREVVADYFPDNKSARVSMSVKTKFNIASLFMAEIKQAGTETRVQVFYLKGNPVFAEAVEQWTKENYTFCPFT